MIGLLVLAGIGLWIVVAVMLSKRIPQWVGVKKYTKTLSVLVFPLVLAAPIADDLIGRWQFYQLCDREAVVILSPDWKNVTRAKRADIYWMAAVDGYFVPIRLNYVEYVDSATGRPFLSHKTFIFMGGFLHRNLYGLGQKPFCSPRDLTRVTKELSLDYLIEQGKDK